MSNELFTVRPPANALGELLERAAPVEGLERIAVRCALGRTIARDVAAGETLPAFDRSTMDGYAVRAADTAGAAEGSPAYLPLAGEVAMGTRAAAALGPGTAIRVHTGAMLPAGADAVVIVEETNLIASELEVLRAAAPGDNTIAAGDDIVKGAPAFAAGHRLRAADLGALHALGITSLEVRRRPVVAVLSTGDELQAPETPSLPAGTVRDANTATLCAVIEAAGGVARSCGIARDDLEALHAAARAALDGADALVLSAGSSVSVRDLTARALERLGPPGIFVHGIALRPGKPTLLAFAGTKPVVGLPGNPVSAAVVAMRFVAPLVRRLSGMEPGAAAGDGATVTVHVAASVPSRPGREDYVPCALARDPAGALVATPLFGSSSLLFTLVRADALLVVPFDRAGLAAGERAEAIVL